MSHQEELAANHGSSRAGGLAPGGQGRNRGINPVHQEELVLAIVAEVVRVGGR